MKPNILAATFIVALSWCASTFGAITVDTVIVGNPGNPADFGIPSVIRYGSVARVYSIGKYEVTIGQYTAFLNAVAATDTYGLFNPSMATDGNIAGISQNGTSGSYTYSAIGSPNHPISYVGWGDAARFCNWLHNGQPTGAQGPGTTETGAYSLNGAITNSALSAVTRTSSATWFIPTANEWYKAAYYQPAAQGGDSDGYWAYPMRTNDEPYSDQPSGATPDNSRVANYFNDDSTDNGYNDGYAVTGSQTRFSDQNYLTDVGAYSSSPSYYGTFDQGGNVWEWTETAHSSEPSRREIRGGSFFGTGLGGAFELSSRGGSVSSPALENGGFRVATIFVPEPSPYLLCASAAIALIGCLGRNRRASA